MDDKQRLKLQDMIKVNNVIDQTTLIRDLKHSVILRNEVTKMLSIKSQYKENEEKIYDECINECKFLFTYYTDIFNKIRKDELDIDILNKFLDILEKIEFGDLDQHEGSFLIGTYLKELYIDSALKKADKLNKEIEISKEPIYEHINVTWKQFKQQNK